MLNQKLKRLSVITLSLFLVFTFLISAISAYDNRVAHPNLTAAAVGVYNQAGERKVSDEEKDWIVKGSIDEDMDPRYLNHFYNPKTGAGLYGFHNAREWAKIQFDYSGDYSIPSILDNYRAGDKLRAYQGVGHILHLLEDMGTPAHARVDPHSDGDPYEKWVSENGQISGNFSLKTFSSPYDAMHNLANFTYDGFYSRDSIDTSFGENDIRKEKDFYGNEAFYLYKNSKIMARAKIMRGGIELSLDDKIHSSYYSILSREVVGYAAGVIDNFQKEFTKIDLEKEEARQKMGPIAKNLNYIAQFTTGFFKEINYAIGDNLNLGREVGEVAVAMMIDAGEAAGVIMTEKADDGKVLLVDTANTGKKIAIDAAVAGRDAAVVGGKATVKGVQVGTEYAVDGLEEIGDEMLNASDVVTDAAVDATIVGGRAVAKTTLTGVGNLKDMILPGVASAPITVLGWSDEAEEAHVKRVIDGDTIELDNGDKVRYIGVDTPELNDVGAADDECLAWAARSRNAQLLSNGRVFLYRDPSVDRDKYNRLLRYVYVGQNFVNRTLVAEGLGAMFFCKVGYKNCPITTDMTREGEILKASHAARANKRGIYSDICKKEDVVETDEKEDVIAKEIAPVIVEDVDADLAPITPVDVSNGDPAAPVISEPNSQNNQSASASQDDSDVPMATSSIANMAPALTLLSTPIDGSTSTEAIFRLRATAHDLHNDVIYEYSLDGATPSYLIALSAEREEVSNKISATTSVSAIEGILNSEIDFEIGLRDVPIGVHEMMFTAQNKELQKTEIKHNWIAGVRANHLVINQIGLAGTTTYDEFVEIYNPSDLPVDLLNYRLTKKTESGKNEYNLLTAFPNFELRSRSSFLIVHPDGYKGRRVADGAYSTSQSLADDNSVILYADQGKKVIVDKVAWGTATGSESSSFSLNVGAGQSLMRKWSDNNGVRVVFDSDNNADDFVSTSSAPQSSWSPSTPAPSSLQLISNLNFDINHVRSMNVGLKWSVLNSHILAELDTDKHPYPAPETEDFMIRYRERKNGTACDLQINWSTASSSSATVHMDYRGGNWIGLYKDIEYFYSAVVDGLNPDTEYCFGVMHKVNDGWSLLSNQLPVRTLQSDPTSPYVYRTAHSTYPSDEDPDLVKVQINNDLSIEDDLLLVFISHYKDVWQASNTQSVLLLANGTSTSLVRLAGQEFYDDAQNYNDMIEAFYLTNPPLGDMNISVSLDDKDSGKMVNAVLIGAVNQTDPFYGVKTKYAEAGTLNQSFDASVTNSLIIDAVHFFGVSKIEPIEDRDYFWTTALEGYETDGRKKAADFNIAMYMIFNTRFGFGVTEVPAAKLCDLGWRNMSTANHVSRNGGLVFGVRGE